MKQLQQFTCCLALLLLSVVISSVHCHFVPPLPQPVFFEGNINDASIITTPTTTITTPTTTITTTTAANATKKHAAKLLIQPVSGESGFSVTDLGSALNHLKTLLNTVNPTPATQSTHTQANHISDMANTFNRLKCFLNINNNDKAPNAAAVTNATNNLVPIVEGHLANLFHSAVNKVKKFDANKLATNLNNLLNELDKTDDDYNSMSRASNTRFHNEVANWPINQLMYVSNNESPETQTTNDTNSDTTTTTTTTTTIAPPTTPSSANASDWERWHLKSTEFSNMERVVVMLLNMMHSFSD